MAVVVLVVVALLLLAMLVAGARRAAAVRHAGIGATVDDPLFRSHAEASRGDEDEQP